MAHTFMHEGKNGDLVDLTYFCSDFCHRQWCERTGNKYGGWNGCHELYSAEQCASCGMGLTYFDEEEGYSKTAPNREVTLS